MVIRQKHLAGHHLVRLNQRVKRKRNYQKVVVAVTRHMAEAAYWVLKELEVYQDPQPKLMVTAKAQATNALSSTHG